MAFPIAEFVEIILVFLVVIGIIVIVSERIISSLRVSLANERVRMNEQSQAMAEKRFNQWTESSLSIMKKEIEEATKKEYNAKLQTWKTEEENNIREDAIRKSINTLLGRIGEEFSPVLLANKFGINLKDFRHLGTPVDFVAFKGLSDDVDEAEIIFLEIKSGKSSGLVPRERKVRDAVSEKRVRYEVVNMNEIVGNLKAALTDPKSDA